MTPEDNYETMCEMLYEIKPNLNPVAALEELIAEKQLYEEEQG